MENIDEVLLRVAHDREGVAWGWSKRCEPFMGTWTPADHLYFLHGSEDVKQDHYVTIARSNAHGLQNDVDGAFEAELKEDNQRRYERELRAYEVAQAEGRNVRKPRRQSNIQWVQDSIPVSCLHDAHERSAFNLMYENSFDAYVCMSTSWARNSRTTETLSTINCLWLDLDLKDNPLCRYSEELAYMFLECLELTGILPMPNAVVKSGGGVHVYWKTSPIPAEALPRFRALMKHLHLKVGEIGFTPDPKCVDPVRVLRLCKTQNSKYERSKCELLWRSDTLNARYSFDDLCDAVLPLTREEYRLQQEKENHEKQKKSAQYERRQSNTPDGYKKNSYEVILSDLRKLSILKRFASSTAGLRDKFLFNFTVACSWCMHISQIRDELHKLCKQMKLNLDEFWSYLQSVFKRIEKGTRHKYRLSPPTVIDELKITLEEMLDLNLRILRNKEAKKIQKRVAKAEERNQLKPPQPQEEIHRAKHEAQREAFSLHWEGMSKPQIAKLLGISERTVYRYLKGT